MEESANRFQTSRRTFLAAGVGGLFCLSPLSAFAAKSQADRVVSLLNTHTCESLTRTYWSQGAYIPEVLLEINHVLRDFRSDEETFIDPRLLDILTVLRARTGCRQPFEVISAYRSPETNAMLRGNGRGVAKNSFHIAGKAVDIRIPGVSNRALARLARSLQTGGVGAYRRFVHIDTGPVRSWGRG